jgi:hypothetical protein
MTAYVPAASSLLNAPAYALALVGLALIGVLAFVLVVLVKLPSDAEWAELKLGRFTAKWGRKRDR